MERQKNEFVQIKRLGAETVRIGVQWAVGMESQATQTAMRLIKEVCWPLGKTGDVSNTVYFSW